MTDAVLSWRHDSGQAGGLGRLELDGHALVDLLEDLSFEVLRDAVSAVEGRRGTEESAPVVLFTRDGRTLEADILPRIDAVTVEVHDVSRHVDEADRFVRMALDLHRRNRDLQTLYDVTTVLGETLDVGALVQATADSLGAYLAPAATVVTAVGHEGRWSKGEGPFDPTTLQVTARILSTARGDLGTVAWWRQDRLTIDEERVVDVVLRKAAISIDHALLLTPHPDDAERDDLGLLSAPAARRALAGFVGPYAVALIRSPGRPGDLSALATAMRHGRAGDVKAWWGPDQLLVALRGADVAALRGWLTRVGLDVPSDRWSVGVAMVERDVDAAIQEASAHLDSTLGQDSWRSRDRWSPPRPGTASVAD